MTFRLLKRGLIAVLALLALAIAAVFFLIPRWQLQPVEPVYASEFRSQLKVTRLAGATDTVQLQGAVRDQAGRPITALVRLYNARRTARHLDLVTQEYTALDGLFTLEAAPGDYELYVYKGPEYEYFIQPLTLSGGSNLKLDVALHQLIDMAALGWYAGDPHQHSAFLDGEDEVADLLRYNTAVGLHFSVQTDHNVVGQNVVARNYLRDVALHTTPEREYLALGGDEISTSIGHMIAWEPRDASGEYVHIDHQAPAPDQPMAQKKRALERLIGDFDRHALFKQINHPGGGTRAYEHFGEKRGDSFMDVDFDWVENQDYILAFDATETWNGGSGFLRSMYYFGSQEKHPFEAMERVFHEWFRLLNTGARFPSLGSSDTHDARADRDRAGYTRLVTEVRNTFGGLLPYIPPRVAYKLFGQVEGALIYQELDFVEYALEEIALLPGSARTYIYTGGEFSGEALARNVAHSFITSGPLLRAQVDGAMPGQVAVASESNQLQLDILSHKPLQKLMIIVDGELHREIPLADVMQVQQTLELDLRGKRWLLVYAEGHDNYAYAFTNPIYLD